MYDHFFLCNAFFIIRFNVHRMKSNIKTKTKTKTKNKNKNKRRKQLQQQQQQRKIYTDPTYEGQALSDDDRRSVLAMTST